jgi:hypothetical protein
VSEYQYYEFAAIDNPLTPKQLAELRARSSRAVITPTSFTNHYEWGDLKGDPLDWMRRYFDAHVYVANWCSCWLYLKLPKDTFDAETLRTYTTQSALTADETRQHWILQWALSESEDYDRFAMEDGEGWMARLMPLRDELLRGDLRPLYLGWLAGVSYQEVVGDTIEPVLPQGLSRLTAAQQSLVEFLDIDVDLVTAAGAAEPQAPSTSTSDDTARDAWLAHLPIAEQTAVLKLLLSGRGQQAERQLKSAFLSWQRGQRHATAPAPPRRTVAELWRCAEIAAESRRQQEAAKKRKAEVDRKARREAYLRTLAGNFERHWQAADEHARRAVASGYDAAKQMLVDLAEAYTLCTTRAEFDRALANFMRKHGARTALVRRLVEAGLWKKGNDAT